MQRSILGITTAIALALPATAQTGVEETVVMTLNENGYPETSINLLSEGQIAELYVATTGDDQDQVRTVIQSFDLPTDESADLIDSSMEPTEVEMEVRAALEHEGYSPDMADSLSSGDMTNIYLASTSGDQAGVDDAIESAVDANMTMMEEDPSAAAERAMMHLMRQGHTRAEIEAAATQSELLNLYVALTSGDEDDIQGATAAAMAM